MSNMTTSTWIEAGRAVRGAVKSGLLRSAFEYGVRLDIQEDKGFLGSTYYLTATGSPERLMSWNDAVGAWLGGGT